MNGPTHRLAAAAVVGLYMAAQERKVGSSTLNPFLGAAGASVFTNFPDMLEPATSPNHRAFFHSVAFAGLLATALYKLNQWQPEDDFDKLCRGVGMVALSGYLVHLALDLTTARSLPLIGRL